MLIVAIVAASVPMMVCCSQSPVKTTRTTNQQAEWHIKHLNDRYASVSKAAGGVDFVEGQPDNPKKATMSVGSTITEPDHHGSTKYTITKIEEDGVVIEYFSCFDHRSFGKQLIEEDTGTIKLKWKLAR